MYRPKSKLVFGQKLSSKYFHDLLEENNKYLNEFKRTFNYLKKNHEDYKSIKMIDKVSKDRPLFDYIDIYRDMIELDTNNILTLYNLNDQDENESKVYLSLKIDNKVSILDMVHVINRWKKNKDVRDAYFNYLKLFGVRNKEPLFSILE
tara:strand:- start:334 stop:780 length:447 start_codon:yes stop_codon:yes gene_type:complete